MGFYGGVISYLYMENKNIMFICGDGGGRI